MPAIAERLLEIRARIAAAARACHAAAQVTLVAVSKTRTPAELAAAADAGVTDFGENYLAEAQPKLDALADRSLTWHFIGAVQSNKTRAIAERFDWVHSVDRLRIAQRLAARRPPERGPLNVCVQVNIDAEDSKAGVSIEALPELLGAMLELEGLRVQGLMAIPRARADSAAQREVFARLRRLRDAQAERLGVPLPVLSMGMSADFEAAIAEGATHVRIGSAIFGPRTAVPTAGVAR